MRIEPAASVVGHVVVPGDKSISHRSVVIGALGEGETSVHGFGRSGDTQGTVDAARALGVEVEDVADDELVVHGVGLRGLGQPTPSIAPTPERSCAFWPASSRGRWASSRSPVTNR